MEKIIIKNFGGLKDAEIILNKVNVFIGKQASGKSVTAKLIYFFKSIISQIFIETFIRTEKEIDLAFMSKFEGYFPVNTWTEKPFEIVYYFNENEYIKVEKKKSGLSIKYSELIQSFFTKAEDSYRESKNIESDEWTRLNNLFPVYLLFVKQKLPDSLFQAHFIPASRALFSILESNMFSIFGGNKYPILDPLLLKFGSFYQSLKEKSQSEEIKDSSIDNIIEEILGSKYYYENTKDYLIHNDNRKINLAFASSGQQETLPLLLILKHFAKAKSDSSVLIEEPEAHLFPSAQKKIVELMSLVFNKANEQITNNKDYSNLQFTITTHSPYILSSFNNLVQASISYNQANGKNKKEINKIIPKELHLNPDCLSAYAFRDGKADSIIDPETQLIYAEYLDSVSEDIGSEFSDLLDVE
jgi:predicted ATPase